MEHTEHPSEEGAASRAVVGLLSGLAGMLGGALAAGMWLGGVRAELSAHTHNPEVHMTQREKEQVTRQVIDREVTPWLQDIRARLSRIEAKIDEAGEK